MAQRFMIICVVLVIYGRLSGALQVGREKRIVFGTPLTSDTAYDVVGYFVRIDQPFLFSWVLRWFIQPGLGNAVCGGAALSPHIVQTACHCLVSSWTPAIDGPYKFPIMKNGWEDMLVLQHGHWDERSMDDGVWSRKFLVHDQCVRHNRTQLISHDFGLILTREALKESTNPFVKFSFAPVYTEFQIALQYYRNMFNEAICMFIGFGPYNFEQKKPVAIFGENSPVLQHGWRALRNYWNCHERTQTYKYMPDYTQRNYVFSSVNYTRDCTWGCTTPFGKLRTMTAPGDSGSPVYCDGVYFGLVSSGYIHRFYIDAPISWQYESLLAFAMFENAAEYREDMTIRLWHFWGSDDDRPPPVPNRATINPFNRPTSTVPPSTTGSPTDEPLVPFYWKSDKSKCKCSSSSSVSTIIILVSLVFMYS